MVFRYYTNAVSQASRAVASGILIVGMVLIGFGFMIFLLPKFFATLASIVFWIMGFGCAITAIKIFWVSRKMDEANPDPSALSSRRRNASSISTATTFDSYGLIRNSSRYRRSMWLYYCCIPDRLLKKHSFVFP